MIDKYILILGSKKDFHTNHVYNQLIKNDYKSEIIDASHFPRFINFSWDISNNASITINNKEIYFDEIQSIYWRQNKGISLNKSLPKEVENLYEKNAKSSLRIFLQFPSLNFINNYDAWQLHKIKPHQLRIMKDAGIKIPKTLISNNINEINEFFSQRPKLIIKPVYGGDYVNKVTGIDIEKSIVLTDSVHYSTYNSAYTMQELVEGKNIRTYVFEEKTFSFEIEAETIDFRISDKQKISKYEIPKEIARQAIDITKLLGLKWTAIDWRLNNKNEYYFLEANFSPMFYGFEDATQVPLTDELINLLGKNN